MQSGESAHRLHHEGDQEEGEDDDEEALDEIGDHGRRQSSQQTVAEKKYGHDADGQFRTHGAARDGAGRLSRSQEHEADLQREIEKSVGSVEDGQSGTEPVFKIVGRGQVAHPPEQGCHQPVEGRGEEIEPLVPDPRHPHPVGGAGHRDGVVRMGPGPEGVHDHERLPETAGTHEVVVQVGDLPGRPETRDGDAEQVNDQGGEIQPVQSEHGLKNLYRVRFGRSRARDEVL